MPDLIHSLHGRDLGHLRIIAQFWGVELPTSDADQASEQFAEAVLDRRLVAEVVETLPAEGRSALETLSEQDGRMPWGAFTRRFGEVREMGPGRRDRDKPHTNPVSAAEVLFYRALLARAFFDTPDGPQEFAYIPDDLLPLLSSTTTKKVEALGRPATPAERTHIISSSDHILDDVCTLLAALRLGWDAPPHTDSWRIPVPVLREFLTAANLISDSIPILEPVKSFLEASRGEALAHLVHTWLESDTFNELRQQPGLICEGVWKNNPYATRQFILGLLSAVPPGKWWNLPAFVSAVRDRYPDYQRPAGDYDSWFIRRISDDQYLRGFANWDMVDGVLIRYIITGPLHWLGIVDLASPTPDSQPSAFHFTKRSESLMKGKTLSDLPLEDGKLHVTSQGRIHVPRLVPRAIRYQIARFCEWEPEKPDEFRYRLTPAALEHAREQGLKVEHLLTLLQKHAAAPLPPSLVHALHRWEKNGTEARVENLTVLRLSPEGLNKLRRSRAARFLGEPLGPTTVIIKPGAQSKVLAALAELGFLAEDTTKAYIISDSEDGHE